MLQNICGESFFCFITYVTTSVNRNVIPHSSLVVFSLLYLIRRNNAVCYLYVTDTKCKLLCLVNSDSYKVITILSHLITENVTTSAMKSYFNQFIWSVHHKGRFT